jgi:hypothetical protein
VSSGWESHYRFWNLPIGRGYVLPACTADWRLPPNFRLVTFPVEIIGDTVLNVACS